MERVRERLSRAVQAFESAGIEYAVAGGNAVAAWVSRVDEAAVRNTQDVDMVIRRSDLPSAITVLEAAGFVYRHSAGMDMFLDGPDAKARDAIHLVFAREKVRSDYLLPAPDVSESELSGGFRILTLDALVRMKVTSFRRKDQVHLQDLIEIGLVNEENCRSLPLELSERLKELLADPQG